MDFLQDSNELSIQIRLHVLFNQIQVNIACKNEIKLTYNYDKSIWKIRIQFWSKYLPDTKQTNKQRHSCKYPRPFIKLLIFISNFHFSNEVPISTLSFYCFKAKLSGTISFSSGWSSFDVFHAQLLLNVRTLKTVPF